MSNFESMRLLSLILVTGITSTVNAQDIFSADSTLLFRIGDTQIRNEHDSVLYTINGNIIFEGDSRDRAHMLYLLRSTDFFSREVGLVHNPTMSETYFSLHRGRIHLGPDPTLEYLLLDVKKTDEEVVVQDNRGDIRARWMMTNRSLGNATMLAVLIALVQHYGKDSLLLGTETAFREDLAVIRPYWNDVYHVGYHEWTWDGKTLRPRYGNRPEDEWTFDGRYLRPTWYREFGEEWEWHEDRLEPSWVADPELTHVWDGRTLRPLWGSDLDREWLIEGGRAKPKWSTDFKQEWVIEGEVPVAIIAIVVLGIADR